jgi:hypothetical protein
MPSGYDPMGGYRFSEKIMLKQEDLRQLVDPRALTGRQRRRRRRLGLAGIAGAGVDGRVCRLGGARQRHDGWG